MDEVIQAFEKASRPTVWERTKDAAGILLAGAGVVAVLAAGYAFNQSQKMQTMRDDAEKIMVSSQILGSNLEITNSLVKLDVRAYSFDNYSAGSFPQVPYLEVSANSRISLDISGRKVPHEVLGRMDALIPSLHGRIYLEGFADSSFYTFMSDGTPAFSEYGSDYMYKNYEVPDVKPGVYYLAVELDSPIIPEYSDRVSPDRKKNYIIVENSNKLISRVRIPILVGSVDKTKLLLLGGMYTESDRGIRPATKPVIGNLLNGRTPLDLFLPDSDKPANEEDFGRYLDCKVAPDTSSKLAAFTSNYKGEASGFGVLPLRRYYYSDVCNMGRWQLSVPDTSFHTQAMHYAKKFNLLRTKE